MNILDKWWKRLLIGLLLGGMMSEALKLLTYRKVKISAIFLSIILYFVLNNIYNRSEKNANETRKDEK
ncbi:hypothetical protein FNO01nite_29700 [Flavobacterium noncentrifugens]|uniref:Uncharacterized protein n=1 Tax=Flavobacterium noncentrifugens TaxID=1128970 RepID=A0A1G9BMX7_9FLAO|nr:hypothetical protein FNO01nite_29700 [Flavobacterium noncentrifugens]SDK40504.1 hypothetical protein SAMN04487935_3279 [Flavobacterium noncentrifugens]